MLSEEQLRRVQYLVDDEWVYDTGSPDDELRTWEQFHATLDPMGAEELHQFAANFNCDCGVEELRRVIRHCRCDLGTALMIFWRLGPGWYFQYERPEKVPEYERSTYQLLTEIQGKAVAGVFPRGEIAIDPKQLDGRDLTQEHKEEGGIKRVAAEMFRASPGRFVEVEQLG
jgi:hypothetical protein